MKTASRFALIAASALACAAVGLSQAGAPRQRAIGIFDGQSDVGTVKVPGAASFDSKSGVYSIASSGDDLWAKKDDFHLLWKKVSGDVSLTADIQLAAPSAASQRNRKAFVIFRQSLGADSMYTDAAVHGSGETALQFRRTRGDNTQDIAFNLGAARTVRLEKRGDTITLFVSLKGEPLHQTGASIKLHFSDPFYAGLGVCAHRDALERATFSRVELKALSAPQNPAPKVLYSTLQTVSIDDNARMGFMIVTGKGQMEAPNWSRDGKTLIFDRDGRIWTVPAAGGEPRALDIGSATDCSGSHGLSPDGKWLAITCATPDHPGRRVYIVPSGGGEPRLLTSSLDSYFHSWSPDGKTILFTRPLHPGSSINSISVEGGAETMLVKSAGISDDPDYSPDGKYIYFNSDRAGGMQIFRMWADGSHPEQVTFDERRNWTPHPSPDGKSILMLSYAKDVTGHPANRDVALRVLDLGTGKIRGIVEITGGAGTDNVPNWAPDGGHFAFVCYRMLPAEDNGSSE